MTKQEVLNEIDAKIEMYKKRINTRVNTPCYFDETNNINRFKDEIQALEETKEYINKITE